MLRININKNSQKKKNPVHRFQIKKSEEEEKAVKYNKTRSGPEPHTGTFLLTDVRVWDEPLF